MKIELPIRDRTMASLPLARILVWNPRAKRFYEKRIGWKCQGDRQAIMEKPLFMHPIGERRILIEFIKEIRHSHGKKRWVITGANYLVIPIYYRKR